MALGVAHKKSRISTTAFTILYDLLPDLSPIPYLSRPDLSHTGCALLAKHSRNSCFRITVGDFLGWGPVLPRFTMRLIPQFLRVLLRCTVSKIPSPNAPPLVAHPYLPLPLSFHTRSSNGFDILVLIAAWSIVGVCCFWHSETYFFLCCTPSPRQYWMQNNGE